MVVIAAVVMRVVHVVVVAVVAAVAAAEHDVVRVGLGGVDVGRAAESVAGVEEPRLLRGLKCNVDISVNRNIIEMPWMGSSILTFRGCALAKEKGRSS